MMIHKQRLNSRILSLVLAVAMVLSMLPATGLTAFAADNPTEKNITLGASHIKGAQASNVYFGNYYQSDASGQTKDPIKWRVLSNGDGKLFLLSDQNLDVFEYHKEYEAVTWETSTMRSWLNGLANNKGNGENAIDYTNDNFLDTAFSASEQTAIADTTVVNNDDPSYGTDGGNNTTDKVFLLSIEEAQNTAYGFTDNTNRTDTRKATNTAYVAEGGKIGTSGMHAVGEADYWWLRSPGSNTRYAAYVGGSGYVFVDGYSVTVHYYVVRPAFNINLSSVLFTSAAKGGKSSTAAAVGGAGIFENVDISTLTDNDGYKLTLLDSNRNAFEATLSSVSDKTVTVSYSGAKTGSNEYISAIIKNGSTVKYYGRLGLASESGTATVTLPDDFNAANGDVLCIFNEQYNGDYKTDYASELIEIGYKITFDAGDGTGTMDSVIAIGTYTLPANDFTAPSGYQFKGWATTNDGTVITDTKLTVTADTTLYAKWELIPADAPAVTSSENLTLTYKDYTSKQIGVTVTDPKDGYTYSYQWYDASTNQPISGAIAATYGVPSDLAAGSYSYYCAITAKRDDNGETSSSRSDTIEVVVNKATLTADDFDFKAPNNLVFHPANFKHAKITPKTGVTGIDVADITVKYINEDGQTLNYGFSAGEYKVTIDVAASNNYYAAKGLTADDWTFTITKGKQDAPTGINGVAETICGRNDGKITGVYDEMEYRNVNETDADYKSIEGEEITGLAAGTYYVRMKETNNLFKSDPVSVTVAAGRMLTVTVPSAAEQIGYTIEAPTSCAYGDTVEIKITALEGYGRDENFDVYNNGNLVSNKFSWATGILTLENVTEDVNITLASGSFVDRTKPTAEITLGTNKWNSFWNGLTFGLFFKETQTVTITADDKGSGLYKVYYYISEQEMERTDVNFIEDWTEYNGAFNIDPDRVAVIYAKAVDNAGNFWLANSNGLVFDATAPTLEGIENGKTYYGDLTVIKPAEQFGDIDQVTLDGETMGFVDGTYGRISADNKEHTVVVTDKAGNKTEYKVTVYKKYTVTYKVDDVTVSTQTVGYGKDAMPPAIPEKEGYTQTAPTWDKDGKNITTNTVINAVYTINSYTITLDHPAYDSEILVNHGMSFNEMYPDIDANVDLAAEKDYNTFIGWYESTDGGETLKDTPYDFNTKVTGDITLYPMFKIYTYTVTYKADGKVVGTVTVEHGADAVAPAIPEKEGYTDTVPTWDKDGKNITADTEITAVYVANEYLITLRYPSYEREISVSHGMSFNAMYPDIDANVNLAAEKDYHTFIGWYESTDGGETLKDTPYDFNTKVTGNITLYPLFEIYTYTVTYKADGKVVGTVTVEHGADAVAPAIPEKEGYTQTAPTWDKDGKNITANTEINAVYTINEYTVTFMSEDGVYKTVTVKHGEKVTMPEVPTKDGYTVKWEKVLDTVTEDTTVKAVYTEIPATDKPDSPQTGDNNQLWLWWLLLIVSAAGIAGVCIVGKKKSRKAL